LAGGPESGRGFTNPLLALSVPTVGWRAVAPGITLPRASVSKPELTLAEIGIVRTRAGSGLAALDVWLALGDGSGSEDGSVEAGSGGVMFVVVDDTVEFGAPGIG